MIVLRGSDLQINLQWPLSRSAPIIAALMIRLSAIGTRPRRNVRGGPNFAALCPSRDPFHQRSTTCLAKFGLGTVGHKLRAMRKRLGTV